MSCINNIYTCLSKIFFTLIVWTSVSGQYHVSTHLCQKIHNWVLGKIGVPVFHERSIRRLHKNGYGLRDLFLAMLLAVCNFSSYLIGQRQFSLTVCHTLLLLRSKVFLSYASQTRIHRTRPGTFQVEEGTFFFLSQRLLLPHFEFQTSFSLRLILQIKSYSLIISMCIYRGSLKF